MRINIDLDGVVYDYVDTLRTYLIDRCGYEPETLTPVRTWNFYEAHWGMSKDEWLEHNAMAVDEGYLFQVGNPIPCAIEALKLLEHDGHEIHFVTTRYFSSPAACEYNTRIWLKSHRLDHWPLTITKDKREVAADILLDDLIDNVQAAEEAGQLGYLFDQPWNVKFMWPRRAFGWRNFRKIIGKLSS